MTPEALHEAIERGTLNDSATDLEKSRAEALGRGETKQAARISNDLGVVYFLAGRNVESRAALESARDAFTELDDQNGRAHALGNLARLEEKSGNPKTALALYQQTADLFHGANQPAEEFVTLRSLSQLYLKHGAWLQALTAYDRGLMVKPHRSIFDAFLHWLYQIPLRMLGFSSA
jgi:tetratricopeptide (TPR) repeat protein